MYYSVVDIFCGGGGASAGYHNAGMNTVLAIDNSPHCVYTFQKNFGNVVISDNVELLHGQKILNYIKINPFLVSASPPCEPYTLANEKRINNTYDRMFDDPTGRLMIESIRLIADLNPRYFIIENVLGILQGENDELLKHEFSKVGLPEPFFNIIDAHKWGAPSKRKRVIISNINLKSQHTKKVTVNDAFKGLPPLNQPSNVTEHYSIPLPMKHKKKLPNLAINRALVFFRGANKQYKNHIRLDPNAPANVIMGLSRFFHPFEDRFLTVREQARLMTFPDSHLFYGTTEQKLDMIGEAIPPLIAEQIGKQIIADYELSLNY